jgi:hypothetical protein
MRTAKDLPDSPAGLTARAAAVDVGRSLSADRRRTAKTKVKKGQGDRGDVKSQSVSSTKFGPQRPSTSRGSRANLKPLRETLAGTFFVNARN